MPYRHVGLHVQVRQCASSANKASWAGCHCSPKHLCHQGFTTNIHSFLRSCHPSAFPSVPWGRVLKQTIRILLYKLAVTIKQVCPFWWIFKVSCWILGRGHWFLWYIIFFLITGFAFILKLPILLAFLTWQDRGYGSTSEYFFTQ